MSSLTESKQQTQQNEFQNQQMEKFYDNIKLLIKKKWESKEKCYIHDPTLFGDNSEKNINALDIALRVKQKQMKEGDIAQIIIGNFIGWEDLRRGHSSGMDCRKKDNSIIMEVKNKYNTVKGSDEKKSLLPTLAKYKKDNPNTRCVWAIINPKSGCTKLHETIIYNDVEIEKIQGEELLKLVFTLDGKDYSKEIIAFVRTIMYSN